MKRLKMSNEGPTAPSKLTTKLIAAMEDKKFYEAHQLLKTIYFRHVNSGKLEELEQLLLQYSRVLLENNQIESGCDVAIMLAKLWKENNIAVDANRIEQASRLLTLMPQCPERITFLMTVLGWCPTSPLRGKIHATAVGLYTNEKAYGDAWQHLTRVIDGTEAARLALPILQAIEVRKDEVDILIAFLVLSFLAAKRIEGAEQTFTALVRSQIHELSPLLNGVRFLIESAKMRSSKAFAAVKECYEPSFSRDPYLRRMVATAGKNLFNLSDRTDKSHGGLMPLFLNAFLNPDQPNLD